jgi:hypothetical protein
MASIGRLLIFMLMLHSTVEAGFISVDKNIIEPEDYFQLSLTLEGDDELVKIKNIDKFIIESQSSSSSYRYINGRASSEKTIRYELTLKDPAEKQVTIGPAILLNNGKNIESNKIVIRTILEKKSKSKQKDYFLIVNASRNEVIVNETIGLTLQFFNRLRLVEASIEEPESNKYFLKQQGKEKNFRKLVDGKEYNVTEIVYRFTPTMAGETIIPSFTLKGLAVVPERSRQRGFGGLFEDSFFNSNFGKRKRIKASSEPISLMVQNFPESGKPADFTGIVGDFKITQDLKKVAQNNSYRLKVSISGNGDLSVIDSLEIPTSNAYSIYAEKSGGDFNNKTFSMIIIPKRNGVFTLPKSKFNYFSIKDKKYKALVYGGQELIFNGVNNIENKTGPEPSKSEDIKREEELSIIEGEETQEDRKKLTDIIITNKNGSMERVYWFLIENFYFVFCLFLVSGIYFIYLDWLKKITSLFKLGRSKSYEKKLLVLMKKDEISAQEILEWLRSALSAGKVSGSKDLDQLKSSKSTDVRILGIVRQLESCVYGENNMMSDEFVSFKNDLLRILEE